MRAVIILTVAVGLMGCEQFETQTRAERVNLSGWDFLVVVDKATGCQYLFGYKYGITARLGRDGKPMCGAP